MSSRIFTNGEEGKILTSVGNRIVKQPYEFGNAFQNKMGLNNYFESSDINLPVNWSVLILAYIDPIIEDNGVMQAISTTLNLSDNLVLRANGSSTTIFNQIDNLADGFVYSSSANRFSPKYIYSSPDTLIAYQDSNLSYKTASTQRTSGTRNVIRLATSGHYISNSPTQHFYFNSLSKLNRCYIFDRHLSLSELLYFRNNLLFSDLLSMEGLIHDYKFDRSEVINIGGVDYPCIADMAGTSHLRILNLPAGTAQQKVDYANANLFVPFI